MNISSASVVPPAIDARIQHSHQKRDDKAARESDKAAAAAEQRQREEDSRRIAELAARDREVRAHEQAHAAVGGVHAGPPTYTFEQGPNGRNYAVGGEVSISTSPVAGDPEATIRKADQVKRAALAPAQPSAQDRAVAAQATQLKIEAQLELREAKARERDEQANSRTDASRDGLQTGDLHDSSADSAAHDRLHHELQGSDIEHTSNRFRAVA